MREGPAARFGAIRFRAAVNFAGLLCENMQHVKKL